MKTALGTIKLGFHYFAACFFKSLGIHLSREVKKRYSLVVSAFTAVSLFACWNDHENLPIFRCPSRTPGHLTHTSQPMNSSVQGFEHFMSDFIAACSLPSLGCFDSLEDFGCSGGIFPNGGLSPLNNALSTPN